jgi:acetoin utilization protein AcuB
MLMPAVERFMTREPYSIASTESLARARRVMVEHEIRHLPVIDGEQLVGVLAERDIEVVAAVPGIELASVEVARAMVPAIAVWSSAPLDEVSQLMSANRRDCVVVKGGQGVEGIFTASDAMRALAELLAHVTA